MPFDAIYMTHVPGTAVMVFLVGLIVMLRRRWPRLNIGIWLLSTGFIMLSQLGWFFNGGGGVVRMDVAHSVILLGQMLSGASLLLYGRGIDRRWAMVNMVPMAVFVTIFGFYGTEFWVYGAVGVAGLVVLVGTSWWRGVGWRMALCGAVPLGPAMVFAGMGWFRMAGYWVLAAVYGLAFVHLRRVLPEGTVGRLSILTSVGLWTLVYGTHAWVIHHAYWRGFGDEVWTLLKYVLVIGMILVMLEEQVEENQHLALHDPLTGLPNRRSLMDWLDRAIWRSKSEGIKVTLLLVDLNGFKKVNDTYGHLVGDDLLVTVARRMRSAADPEDLLVRLGGDEFVLASTQAWEVEAMETRMQRAIGEAVEIGGETIRLGGSFGVAVFPEDVKERDGEAVRSALLRVADERMYARKGKG